MGLAPNQPIQYIKITQSQAETVDARIITESSASLTVNGEVWLSFMCTPIDLEALAVGFLFNEGIIQSREEIALVQVCEHGDNVDVWLTHPVTRPVDWRRTSGCTGGITSGEAIKSTARVNNDDSFPPKKLLGCMDRLFQVQDLYREVRGVHGSILTDGEEILAMAEDIGRHNTLDKIAGIVVMNPPPPGRRIILTTGRISSEMLQKAARLSVTIVISRTSPSSLSIELAEEMGITLIGYARRNQFNVYAHPERLGLDFVERTYPVADSAPLSSV